jgi:hypothetical protein
MYKRTLAALALLTLIFTFTANAQTQQPVKPAEQKPQPSEAELKAKTDKQRAIQWYVIEPMAFCRAEGIKILKEQGKEALDARYELYRSRIEAATFEELFGLDPKSTDDILPTFKTLLKFTLANDLLEMWRRGACKEASDLTIPVR